MVEAEQLQKLVDDQLIVGLACLTPKGNIQQMGKKYSFIAKKKGKKYNT